MLVIPYLEFEPQIGSNMTAEEWVTIIGRAEIGTGCYFGKLATLRADGEYIRIGSDCWFGDYSTVHIADSVYGTRVGANVTVGHYGLVHACTIGDQCVLGQHAVVMDGSVVGPGAAIAAESVVPPGKNLEGGWLYAGTPAKPVEQISPARLAELHESIRNRAVIDNAEIIRAKTPVGEFRRDPGTGVHDFESDQTYIAPTASIAGNLKLAPHASIWFAVEVDAEGANLEIGEASNIQDNSRIYLEPGENMRIGRRVTVGHNVRMYACEVEDEAIIGMGCIVGKGTIVRNGGVIAAGAVTAPGTEVAAGTIWAGNPARRSRPLSEQNAAFFSIGVDVYKGYTAQYRAAQRAVKA
ncbi:MAG: gamma carbonic anhydrase family protein [Burkholderiales bacterium]|jgi:carbonic anhydrase/acetyltransferase-like protein (isoleucine patch superfamily)